MINEEYNYSVLTEKIIGCAMRVHFALGKGFTNKINLFFKGIRECCAYQEIIYQRALEIEMTDSGINFSREFEMPVFYKQH